MNTVISSLLQSMIRRRSAERLHRNASSHSNVSFFYKVMTTLLRFSKTYFFYKYVSNCRKMSSFSVLYIFILRICILYIEYASIFALPWTYRIYKPIQCYTSGVRGLLSAVAFYSKCIFWYRILFYEWF
jgi:hypothetical protein